MRGRVLTTAVVACAIGAALFAMAADRDGGPDAAAEPRDPVRSSATVKPPSSPQVASAGAPSGVPKRGRVPAGVLARAVSRRAQEREAAGPRAPPERRRSREQGDVISIEIDWHASTAAER